MHIQGHGPHQEVDQEVEALKATHEHVAVRDQKREEE